MKVFFAASMRGKKQFKKQYEQIYNIIEKSGFTHLSKNLIKQPPEEFYKNLDEGGREANVSFYNRNIKYLKEANINVFECSLHSLSIGFMIVKSLEFNKPTLVLYKKNYSPYFLVGTNEDKLIIKEYTEKNLKQILEISLKEARHQEDKRFNFFISPNLLTYLENSAKSEKITKSTFIRNLILEHKRRNIA